MISDEISDNDLQKVKESVEVLQVWFPDLKITGMKPGRLQGRTIVSFDCSDSNAFYKIGYEVAKIAFARNHRRRHT